MKQLSDSGGSSGEVDKDIAFVFSFGELLHDGGFADPSGTFYKQGGLTVGFGFPCGQFAVYFSFIHDTSPFRRVFDSIPVIFFRPISCTTVIFDFLFYHTTVNFQVESAICLFVP